MLINIQHYPFPNVHQTGHLIPCNNRCCSQTYGAVFCIISCRTVERARWQFVQNVRTSGPADVGLRWLVPTVIYGLTSSTFKSIEVIKRYSTFLPRSKRVFRHAFLSKLVVLYELQANKSLWGSLVLVLQNDGWNPNGEVSLMPQRSWM